MGGVGRARVVPELSILVMLETSKGAGEELVRRKFLRCVVAGGLREMPIGGGFGVSLSPLNW